VSALNDPTLDISGQIVRHITKSESKG
jgi:hypothetical protein